MNEALRLLADFRGRGVQVWVEGDSVRYRTQQGSLSPREVDQLRAHKQDVLSLLNSLGSAEDTLLPAIDVVERDKPLMLSFAQQRLWFLSQIEGVSEAYHIPLALRLRGVLHEGALCRALDRLVRRHEALRSVFGTQDGEGIQKIEPAERGFSLMRQDLAGEAGSGDRLLAAVLEEAQAPFDLQHGPLVRGRLIRLAAQDHALLITMHHINSDGWSIGILARELSELYGAFVRGQTDPLPPLPIQYADYAAWQRRWLSGEVLTKQSEYWRKTLADAPGLLELPADRKRPAQQDFSGDFVSLQLDEQMTAGLKALSQQHGMTLFMTVLAGWALVLSRLSGQKDVVIGTPTANRTRAEVEGLIGFFVNTLALRIDCSGNPTVEQLLLRTRAVALGAQEHQDLPFEQVVEVAKPVRSLAHTPLFQVVFAWESYELGSFELPGLQVSQIPVPTQVAKFDLMLSLGESAGRLVGGLNYATALFDRQTAQRYAGYLRQVLMQMLADGSQPAAAVNLLPAQERDRIVVEWNDTRVAYPQERCIHELFEAQVARDPEATAVVFEDRTLSYGELNTRANQLAHHLRGLGVGPDDRVAICVERSLEMVVGLLAILKAGGAYVPLDPAYPAERLVYMLQDSAPVVALSQGAARSVLASASAGLSRAPRIIDLQFDAGAWAGRPVDNPDLGTAGLTSQHLAYVIYTSGSTGVPKGITVAHAPVINLIDWVNRTFQVGPADSLLFVTSVCFDLSVYDIFGVLAAGARIRLASQDAINDPRQLARILSEEEITFWDSAPAALQVIIPFLQGYAADSPLRLVFNSGDWIPLSLPGAIWSSFPNARFISLGGATEATVWSNWFEVLRVAPHWKSIPYGRPIQNARYYILDSKLQPVPIGVVGDLYISGECLANGYTDPQLSRERFLVSPFVPGDRLYNTGDLGRYLPDGNIEFLGRNDFQVKIRGFRIELGEIEARLLEHPQVREAVVLAREDVPGDKRLVAYYTAAPDRQIAVEALKGHLSRTLASYMVPVAYVPLETLPLTPNGKLDRKALPAPPGQAYGTRSYEPPRGAVESALAGIWSEVLGVERVGRHDNFFELGGHSLSAVPLLERLRREGFHVDVRALFAAPTLSELAEQAVQVQEIIL